MSKFFSILVVTLLSCALFATLAEAKRFGGGKSFGYQRQNIGQQAPPRSPQSQGSAAPAPTTPAQSGNRWLGPLAGLAAGGLLASLFMGHGFDGIKPLDIALILGLAALIFLVMRAMRRPTTPQASGSVQYAGMNQSTTAFEPAGTAITPSPSASTRPSWFDEQAFLRTAKGHFIRLQAASDTNNLNDIREYTTPEIYAEISLQSQERNGAIQHTEMVTLNAELLDLITEGDLLIASVRFHGTIREELNGSAEPFDEIWYIQRSQSQANANWYIAGIQQTPIALSSMPHAG